MGPEQDFPLSKLLKHGSRTSQELSPVRHFRGGKVRLLKRSSESGEDCSSRVLFLMRIF
jgi:hypothetical protein